MKKEYTNENINQFFKQFKELSMSYKLEKVHQLIENPNAMATHRVKFNFKPLKFIIMTSLLITGLSVLMLWMTPQKNENYKIVKEYHSPDNVSLVGVARKETKKKELVKQSLEKKVIFTPSKKENKNETLVLKEEFSLKIPETLKEKELCDWPLDTTIDKKSLFIYLSAKEVKKLGVILDGNSMYYHNKTPDGKYKELSATNWKGNRDRVTHYEFHMHYRCDTACTRYRWGHPFYFKVDTLIPIVIDKGKKLEVLWFSYHHKLFNTLPKRYRRMEKTFTDLICVKKMNPAHQFVNYWSPNRNNVIDKINYLELSNKVLEKLGFQILKDSISLVHPEFDMFFNAGKRRTSRGTFAATGEIPYPPNPLPVLITDEKGLKQGTYGRGVRRITNYEAMFDILVPVKIPLNELISTLDYYQIFWFYPTDEFIDALPDEIKYELKKERDNIIEGNTKSTSSCTYFEACKSTLQVNNIKVYPNPVSEFTTIEFSLEESLEGEISIVGISGNNVKTVVPNTTFLDGTNTYSVNVSDINPGIYLILITTDKGFKSQRIIISR